MSIASRPTTEFESISRSPQSKRGEPTWEMAELFPHQGNWTEADYLALETNQLIEFCDGVLEFLPSVTPLHQDILLFLHHLLVQATAGRHPGRAYIAPLRVRLPNGHFREPDVVFAKPELIVDRRKPIVGAELVIEIASGSQADRNRDYVDKRDDYAIAKIHEYWIVDPDDETITVLNLVTDADRYEARGVFKRGQTANSGVFPEFIVDVSQCLDAGSGLTT